MKTPTFELLDIVCNTSTNTIINTNNQYQPETGVSEKYINDPDMRDYGD